MSGILERDPRDLRVMKRLIIHSDQRWGVKNNTGPGAASGHAVCRHLCRHIPSGADVRLIDGIARAVGEQVSYKRS